MACRLLCLSLPLYLLGIRESTSVGSSLEHALDNTPRARVHDVACARRKVRVDFKSHLVEYLESSRIQLPVTNQTLSNHRLSCTALDVVSKFHRFDLGAPLAVLSNHFFPRLQG